MKEKTIESLTSLFTAIQDGKCTVPEAIRQLSGEHVLPDAVVDTQRSARTGHPEAVYGAGKTPTQCIHIARSIMENQESVLITRCDPAKGAAICDAIPNLQYDPISKCVFLKSQQAAKTTNDVGIICAGTSDLPVAEEAAVTLASHGHVPARYTDIGVAGIHRLLSRLDEIRTHGVLIVVAGMEGALPSVVAGLVRAPVIAVPTSVGYGAHLHGFAALLGMLNSCAPGVTVVNIDNGYGAALAAARILECN